MIIIVSLIRPTMGGFTVWVFAWAATVGAIKYMGGAIRWMWFFWESNPALSAVWLQSRCANVKRVTQKNCSTECMALSHKSSLQMFGEAFLLNNVNLSAVPHNPFDSCVTQLVSCGLICCSEISAAALTQAGRLTWRWILWIQTKARRSDGLVSCVRIYVYPVLLICMFVILLDPPMLLWYF